MSGGPKSPKIEIDLVDARGQDTVTVKIDVIDNSLSRKWLPALEHLLVSGHHLEKNYCFMGFADSERHGAYLCAQINNSIDAINAARIGYQIRDRFSMVDLINNNPEPGHPHGRNPRQERLNDLHRYFEDLQGVSGDLSPYYLRSNAITRWHIRQLNLLCHEFESWALSWRKQLEAPDWQRPSQLMCWLNSPRYTLDSEDLKLFGINTLSRPLGGVFVGVNKAVGKHHWEVFHDEGRDSRVDELRTTVMRSQTEAAGDFDIEWARDPTGESWQEQELADFRRWLESNGFDPDDPTLTIGHPQVAQVDLESSFGTKHYHDVWKILNNHLDVREIRTPNARAVYEYHWRDWDYPARQISILAKEQK